MRNVAVFFDGFQSPEQTGYRNGYIPYITSMLLVDYTEYWKYVLRLLTTTKPLPWRDLDFHGLFTAMSYLDEDRGTEVYIIMYTIWWQWLCYIQESNEISSIRGKRHEDTMSIKMFNKAKEDDLQPCVGLVKIVE